MRLDPAVYVYVCVCVCLYQHHLLKTYSFSIECLVESHLTVNVRFISGLVILCHWFFISILMPIPHCLNYYSLVVVVEVGKCDSPNFVIFFRIILVIFGPWNFDRNFRSIFSIAKEKSFGILIGIELNLLVKLKNIVILTILSLQL